MYVEGNLRDISFEFEYMPRGSFNLDVSVCSVNLEITEFKTDLKSQKELKELTKKKIYITTEPPKKEWKLFTENVPEEGRALLMKDLTGAIHIGVLSSNGVIVDSYKNPLYVQVFYWQYIT